MKLAFFDFDGTLFRSPPPPAEFAAAAAGRSLKAIWWNRSTGLLPPCIPQRPGPWWWHGKTVRAAKKAIRDPNVVAVLATGRPAEGALPARIRELLSNHGLRFAQVHLKPEASMSSTPWKQSILRQLLEEYPITEAEIWEDRHLDALADHLRERGIPVEGHLVTGAARQCLQVP